MKKDETKKLFETKKELHDQLLFLNVWLTEWIYVKDLHYENVESREKRMNELLRLILGGPDGTGLLQDLVDAKTGGLITSLREDFPTIRMEELLVFSYSAVGFNNDITFRLIGVSCKNSVSVIRTRLRYKIIRRHSKRKDEYLALLPKKGCRIGKEMLSLQDSSKAFYGNSKKNQNQGSPQRKAGH